MLRVVCGSTWRSSMAPSEKKLRKLAKKAHKFTCLLGKRLKDGEFNGKKKKLRKLFESAIMRLTEDDLRNTLNTEFPKYLQTLEENVLGKSSKPVLSEVKTNDLPEKSAKKTKKKKLPQDDEHKKKKKRKTDVVEENFPYNLYVDNAEQVDVKRLLSQEPNEPGRCFLGQTVTSLEPKKIDNLLENAFEGGEDWARQAEVLCEVITGDQRPMSLKQAMLHLNRVLADQSEAIMQLKTKKLKAAVETLKKLLMFFHLKWSTLEEKFTHPPYADLMAALLSMYADMVVTLSRSVSDEERDVLVRHLLMTSVLLVQPEYLCDVILQQAAVEIQDVQALLPFWRYALLTPRNVSVPVVYTKYMCALRHVLPNIEGQEKDEFFKVALSVVPPANYLPWLLDLDSGVLDETPLTVASPGGAVTRHLVEEASEDAMENLLNLLTAEVNDLEEQAVSPSEETPSTSDAAPLFFIDKTATGGQTVEGEKAAEDDGAERYIFSETEIDNALNHEDDSESGGEEVSEGSEDENEESEDEEGQDREMEEEDTDASVEEDQVEEEKTKRREADVQEQKKKEEKEQEEEEKGGKEEEQEGEEEEEAEDDEVDDDGPKRGRDFIDLEAEEEEQPMDAESGDEDFINDSEEESLESDSDDNSIEIESDNKIEEVAPKGKPLVRKRSTIVIESDEEDASAEPEVTKRREADVQEQKKKEEKEQEEEEKGGKEEEQEGEEEEEAEDDEVDDDGPKRGRDFIDLEAEEEEQPMDAESGDEDFINDSEEESLESDSDDNSIEIESDNKIEEVAPKGKPLVRKRSTIVIESDEEDASAEPEVTFVKETYKDLEEGSTESDQTLVGPVSEKDQAKPRTPVGDRMKTVRRTTVSPLTADTTPVVIAEDESDTSSIVSLIETRLTTQKKIESKSPLSNRTRSRGNSLSETTTPAAAALGSPFSHIAVSPRAKKAKESPMASSLSPRGRAVNQAQSPKGVKSPKSNVNIVTSPKSQVKKSPKSRSSVSGDEDVQEIISPKKTKSPVKQITSPEFTKVKRRSVVIEEDEDEASTQELIKSPKAKETTSPKSSKTKASKSPGHKTLEGSPEKPIKAKSPAVDSPSAAQKPKRGGRKSLARLEMTPGAHDEDTLVSPRHTRTGRILDSPAKSTPKTTRAQTPKSDKPTTAVSRRRSALGIPQKDVFDFTSDIETPAPLRGAKVAKRVAVPAASDVSMATPKKTRAAQLVEEEVGTPRRRSRRLSTDSLGASEAEEIPPPAAPSPRGAGPKLTPRPGTPAVQGRSTRRKSVLPVVAEDQSSPTSKVSPKRLPSAEKKKPLTRRRSMLLSQPAGSPSTQSPARAAKKRPGPHDQRKDD